MPKSFATHEREYIKKRLLEEASQCLKLYGVKKTTIDELVKRVNISKGSFYLFYISKEALFFDVLCDFHNDIHNDILAQIDELGKDVSAEKITEIIFNLYKKIETSFLYKFIINGELELLIRKLPDEITQDHIQQDDLSMEQFLSKLPGINTTNLETYSAALRAVFLSMLYRREIGDHLYDNALKLILRGIVIQMFKENNYD